MALSQTADVDFHALRKAALKAGEGAVTVGCASPAPPSLRVALTTPSVVPCAQAWGPITQSEFLHNMGIGPRMAQLLQANEGACAGPQWPLSAADAS